MESLIADLISAVPEHEGFTSDRLRVRQSASLKRRAPNDERGMEGAPAVPSGLPKGNLVPWEARRPQKVAAKEHSLSHERLSLSPSASQSHQHHAMVAPFEPLV